jgi:hypothetical protein
MRDGPQSSIITRVASPSAGPADRNSVLLKCVDPARDRHTDPCVCPEPVLAKTPYNGRLKWRKKDAFRTVAFQQLPSLVPRPIHDDQRPAKQRAVFQAVFSGFASWSRACLCKQSSATSRGFALHARKTPLVSSVRKERAFPSHRRWCPLSADPPAATNRSSAFPTALLPAAAADA